MEANLVSENGSLTQQVSKNIEWTKKYAARSNIFANLDRKLAIGSTLLENKIMDFEESLKINHFLLVFCFKILFFLYINRLI